MAFTNVLASFITRFSDEDSIKKVMKALVGAKQADYDLDMDMQYRVMPQFRYFRDGLTEAP